MSDLISRLSDWSSISSPLAPLTPAQNDVIGQLGEETRSRPRPAHLPPPTSGHVTGGVASSVSTGSGDHGTSDQGHLWPAFRQLEEGGTSLGTCQQFLQWLHQVEENVVAEQSLPYQLFIDQLQKQLEMLNNLSLTAEDSLLLLETLDSQYCSVSDKTVSLHVACQHLLEEQTRLAELDKDLTERLSVFLSADKVSHKLSSPTLSVHSETFLPLLTTIDTNISYLHAHPHYRDSPPYLTKYRACLSRGLDMIRSYAKRVLDTATAGARQQDTTEHAQSAFTLFYGKFRAAAPKLRHLIQEVEAREDNPLLSEYASLLSDIQGNYFNCRLELLGNSVRGAVAQLVTVHTRDHTGLLRAGCAFLLHVCEDEYQLYSQYFTTKEVEDQDGDNQLEDFLETLCVILYDNLRPLIIHITHLETLAELTSILRNEVVGQHCVQHPLLVSFKRVATQMLADVQERLVYRTSVYIRTDILGYKPAPGDLAYPEKLEMMEKIAESLKAEENKHRGHSRQNSNSSVVSVTSLEVGSITSKYSGNSPADLHGMWYPPVRRTLLTLSKLYRCLELPIFTSLSQEVLSACLQSISSAANIIGGNPAKTRADGQLFEIKHLLILREQIAPFQVDFKVKETSLNFSQIKSAAVSLINHRSDILSINSNNALLEFILHSAPAVQEHLLDSKKDVDRRLKLVCEQFITDTSQTMLGSVVQYNTKVATFLGIRGDKSAKLTSQPWADTNLVTSCVAETVRLIKQNVPNIQRKMQIYLANNETEFILFRPVRSNILTTFVSLLATLRSEYSLDQQTIIGCPTQEQLAAILASVMQGQVSRSASSRMSNSCSRQVSLSPEVAEKKHSIRDESIEEIENNNDTTNGVS